MAETGKRIPADWRPSESDMAFAQSRGLSAPQIQEIADQFRDYWIATTGQRATKRNWPATWRNWIRKDNPANGVRYSAIEHSEQLEVIAAHVRRSWCERGRYSRKVLEQCVAADLLTREQMEAVL